MTREFHSPNDLPQSSADDGEVKVLVASQAFVEFSDWIDRELDKLVTRWERHAAPNAGLPRRKMPK